MMSRSVMIVDDSMPIRALLVATLKMSGYHVLEASDARRAITVIDEGGAVDAIIADLNMPGMSGVALARAIRARPRHKRTPILMLTVESSDAQKAEARGAGVTGWITKPVDSKLLLETIARMLGPE